MEAEDEGEKTCLSNSVGLKTSAPFKTHTQSPVDVIHTLCLHHIPKYLSSVKWVSYGVSLHWPYIPPKGMQVFVFPWALLCLDMSLGQGPVPQQSCNAPWGWQPSVCALSNTGGGSQSWQTRPLLRRSQIAKHLCLPWRSVQNPDFSASC